MPTDRPMPRILLTDADGLANCSGTEPVFIILDILRRDIETQNIASVLERLHVLTDSATNVRRFRESLVFQVDGYNADPRQLPEIEEVRAFFIRLSADWPHWLWFLHRGCGALPLLLTLLCEVRIIPGKNGAFGTEFVHPRQMARTCADLMRRGNALYSTYGITDREAAESADSAIADILG